MAELKTNQKRRRSRVHCLRFLFPDIVLSEQPGFQLHGSPFGEGVFRFLRCGIHKAHPRFQPILHGDAFVDVGFESFIQIHFCDLFIDVHRASLFLVIVKMKSVEDEE